MYTITYRSADEPETDYADTMSGEEIVQKWPFLETLLQPSADFRGIEWWGDLGHIKIEETISEGHAFLRNRPMPSYRRTAREVAIEIMYQPELRDLLLGQLSTRDRERVQWNLSRMQRAQKEEEADGPRTAPVAR